MDQDESFEYDALGNVTSFVHNGTTTRFSTDSLDRDRVRSTWNPALELEPANPEYSYDALGNVTDFVDSAGLQPSLQVSYDPVGRIVRIDDLGGPLEVSIAYGPSSYKETHIVDDAAGTHYASYVIGPFELQQTDAYGIGCGDTLVLSRTISADNIGITRKGFGSCLKTLYNHGGLGGTRFVTDETGTMVQRPTYRAYGETLSNIGSEGEVANTKYLWNGGELYRGLGLVALGPRLYHPTTGRFLQRDPIKRTSSAFAGNPYAFADNDPVNLEDPSGLLPGSGTPTGLPGGGPPPCYQCDPSPGGDIPAGGGAPTDLEGWILSQTILWNNGEGMNTPNGDSSGGASGQGGDDGPGDVRAGDDAVVSRGTGEGGADEFEFFFSDKEGDVVGGPVLGESLAFAGSGGGPRPNGAFAAAGAALNFLVSISSYFGVGGALVAFIFDDNYTLGDLALDAIPVLGKGFKAFNKARKASEPLSGNVDEAVEAAFSTGRVRSGTMVRADGSALGGTGPKLGGKDGTIWFHDNVKVRGVGPGGKTVNVRTHSPNPRYPQQGYTTQIHTNAKKKANEQWLLPDGRWKKWSDLSDAEKAAVHFPQP